MGEKSPEKSDLMFFYSPVLFYIHGGGFAMGSGAGMLGENAKSETI